MTEGTRRVEVVFEANLLNLDPLTHAPRLLKPQIIIRNAFVSVNILSSTSFSFHFNDIEK